MQRLNPIFTSKREALAHGLMLAVTTNNDARADAASRLSEALSAEMSDTDIELAKSDAQALIAADSAKQDALIDALIAEFHE